MVDAQTGSGSSSDGAAAAPGRDDVSVGAAGPGGTRRRRLLLWLPVGGAVAVALFLLAWFQPHKLFVDDKVDQPVPTARATTTTADGGSAAAPSESTTTAPPDQPVELATGSFISLDHAASGTVRVLELGDGRRFVRFEGFETENGPDLFVYLSTNQAGGPESAFDDSYVNLGRLQGNIGDQNYELAPEVDLGTYTSVVVWCDRFDSAFGAADLTA